MAASKCITGQTEFGPSESPVVLKEYYNPSIPLLKGSGGQFYGVELKAAWEGRASPRR